MKYCKWIRSIFIILYIAFIFYITLFNRIPNPDRVFKGLFWEISIGAWSDIFLNIALFVPLGALIGDWKGILLGFFLSLIIEILQWSFCLGYCELDDVLNNTIGVVIGFLIFVLFQKIKDSRDNRTI